jgi:hypothetical protein
MLTKINLKNTEKIKLGDLCERIFELSFEYIIFYDGSSGN